MSPVRHVRRRVSDTSRLYCLFIILVFISVGSLWLSTSHLLFLLSLVSELFPSVFSSNPCFPVWFAGVFAWRPPCLLINLIRYITIRGLILQSLKKFYVVWYWFGSHGSGFRSNFIEKRKFFLLFLPTTTFEKCVLVFFYNLPPQLIQVNFTSLFKKGLESNLNKEHTNVKICFLLWWQSPDPDPSGLKCWIRIRIAVLSTLGFKIRIFCCRRRADVVKFRGGLSVLKSIKKRKSARLKKALRKPPSTKSLLSYLQPKQVSPAAPCLTDWVFSRNL